MKTIPADRIQDLVMMAKSCNYEELSIFLSAFVAEMQRETVIDMCNDDEDIAKDMFDGAAGRGSERHITGESLFENGMDMFVDMDFEDEMRKQFSQRGLARFFRVTLSTNKIVAS